MVVTRSQRRERDELVARATQAIQNGGNRAVRKMMGVQPKRRPPKPVAPAPPAPRPPSSVQLLRQVTGGRYDAAGRLLYIDPFVPRRPIDMRAVPKALLRPGVTVSPDGRLQYSRTKI